ncbi:MAG: hypothetical protein E6J43_06425 [Chloroflexi bacterium]|nr:MAG: hypothetical protein E6J43_06425 [Chloroflexota bacterium]
MLATIPEGFVWAIMVLPLGSLAVISLVSFLGLTRDGSWSARYSGYTTIAAILVAFVLSLWALDSAIDSDGARVGFDGHKWVVVGGLDVHIGITLDGLSALMLVVVTSVSLLVQVYSQEYMRDDDGYNRYYAFMSLFTASMLGLVLASNIVQLFVFWELVGLCSYLLIGFWFYKDSARRAATKAFLVTRLGDLGFLIAILIIFSQTGKLGIGDIHEAAIAGAVGSTALTLFALGLFAGAAGKSAQFPLHVWLPDAMEGPTPVSALIHAATMVAAGVYLVARFFPVFAESEEAITTVAAIGAITAVFDDQPAGVHDDGPRRVRNCGRDLPSLHACVFQGAALSGGRISEPRDGDVRYAQDGRAGEVHAGDVLDGVRSEHGAGRSVSPSRLLEQGRNPERRLG